MFVEVVPNGRAALAVLLRQSFREVRKRHKRTIANLSQMPPDLIDGLRALHAGGAVVGGTDKALEIQRSLPHGHVAAVLGIMRKLEIPRLQGRRGARERDLAMALIAGRVIAPGSKLSTLRGLKPETATSSLGGILELGAIEGREIYAALDWLGAQRRRIERQFAKRHLRDGTLMLYDVILSRRPALRARVPRIQPESPARSTADRLWSAVRSHGPAGRSGGVRRQHRRSSDNLSPGGETQAAVPSRAHRPGG